MKANGLDLPEPIIGCERCERLIADLYRYPSDEARACGQELYLFHHRYEHQSPRVTRAYGESDGKPVVDLFKR